MLVAAISARPADRPSRPSMMLNALVTPTIQRTESGAANTPRWIAVPNRCTTGPSDTPKPTAMIAPSVWARSFLPGADRPDVVQQRHDEHRQHSEPEPGRQVRRQPPPAARQPGRSEQHERDGRDDREPAQPWDRSGVELSLARHVDGADPHREARDERRQRKRHDGSHERGQRVPEQDWPWSFRLSHCGDRCWFRDDAPPRQAGKDADVLRRPMSCG